MPRLTAAATTTFLSGKRPTQLSPPPYSSPRLWLSIASDGTAGHLAVPDSSGLQLLIVEDSPVVRDRLVALAREHLPAESIATAGNGVEALAVFDRSNPDAVVLDIDLPDMSGLRVLEHIRRHSTSTEVIIFTNSGGPEMAARCRLLGANHFVDKAHDINPIIASLRTITARKDRL